jgi:5,10-methylenetetrahydrofolate reductase
VTSGDVTSVDVTNTDAFAGRSWAAAVERCPKHMAHGPCAGVTADEKCELGQPCSFLAVDDGDWPYPDRLTPRPSPPAPRTPAAASFAGLAATRPVVVVDLVAPPLSADGLRRAAGLLAAVADACLTGDHGGARVQFPPAYRARLLADAGIRAWAGISCRDRNRVAIEGEIAACVDAGVTGVHCVTGDHPVSGHRPDAQPVFDLDCVDVAALVATTGVLCSVAHAPAAAPAERRHARLLAKIAAGADAVFIDHCGGPAHVADAVAELRAAGFAGLVIPCVPVVTSLATAAVLTSFAGDRLPAGYLPSIAGQADTAAAGISAASELAMAMLAIRGVDGVNLSCGAPRGYELETAGHLAEVARRVHQ